MAVFGWSHRDIFKTEEAAEEESKDGGTEATAGKNARKVHFLKMIQKPAADHQA